MLSHSGARCTMQQLRISAWAKGRPQRIDIDGHLRPHGSIRPLSDGSFFNNFKWLQFSKFTTPLLSGSTAELGLGKVLENLTMVVPCSGYFKPLNMLHRFLDSLIYQCLEAFSFHSCCPGTTESDRKSLHESGWLSRPQCRHSELTTLGSFCVASHQS